MVRILFVLLLAFTFSFGDVIGVARTFMDSKTYHEKKNLIEALFKDESKFTDKTTGKVDTVAVANTLKTNGLLKLSFHSVKQLNITFDINQNPLLSMKIINNTLERLGYTYYLTKSISRHREDLSWTISMNTQNLIDPTSLANQLRKRGCVVKNVRKSGTLDWTYDINSKNAKLKTISILTGERKRLKKPSGAYWFDVSKTKGAEIESHIKDNWFPKVTFFDRGLRPIEQISEDKDKKRLSLTIPQNATYMSLDDKFSLDNIKHGLIIRLN